MQDQATDSTSTGESSLQSVSGATDSSALAPQHSGQASISTQDASQASQSSTAGETTQGDQQAAYTPDWKFKAFGKEHEIDEWIRPVVKNKEHEQKLKEIYEKAYAIDDIKQSREKAREEYKSYRAQTEPVVQTITQASQLYNSAIKAYEAGNVRKATFQLEEAFKYLGINEKVLQKYVYQKLQNEDMDPRQKDEYNQFRDLELQNAQMQQQMQEQQQYFQQLAVQTRTQELTQATSKPEIASIVSSFDQRNGPGSFHQEVILRGQQYWNMYQKDVSADQLVQEIINKYGLQAPPAQQAQPQAPTAPKEVPVIPIVKGSTGSPAGQQFKSLDDIKAYRKAQYGV